MTHIILWDKKGIWGAVEPGKILSTKYCLSSLSHWKGWRIVQTWDMSYINTFNLLMLHRYAKATHWYIDILLAQVLEAINKIAVQIMHWCDTLGKENLYIYDWVHADNLFSCQTLSINEKQRKNRGGQTQSWYKAGLPFTVIVIWDFSELYRVECHLPTLFDGWEIWIILVDNFVNE